jgi:hypothetical protein
VAGFVDEPGSSSVSPAHEGSRIRTPDPLLGAAKPAREANRTTGAADVLAVPESRGPAVSQGTRWLTRSSAALLPAGVRAEYEEIFLGELMELAETGTSKRGQVLHTLRVLLGIPWLRAALRQPRSRRRGMT